MYMYKYTYWYSLNTLIYSIYVNIEISGNIIKLIIFPELFFVKSFTALWYEPNKSDFFMVFQQYSTIKYCVCSVTPKVKLLIRSDREKIFSYVKARNSWNFNKRRSLELKLKQTRHNSPSLYKVNIKDPKYTITIALFG